MFPERADTLWTNGPRCLFSSTILPFFHREEKETDAMADLFVLRKMVLRKTERERERMRERGFSSRKSRVEELRDS